jgi:Uma2 family endonuclease
MQSKTLVSVEEYLNTSYRPDCDYIEGRVQERNLGEEDHSNFQTRLTIYLGVREDQWGVRPYTEQRVQVKRDRFRVPDLCVIIGKRRASEKIFTLPPFLCIEILSKDDRINEMRERVEDYLTFGVRYVWVVDPLARRAQIYDSAGVHDLKDGMLWSSDPEILVPFDPLFD